MVDTAVHIKGGGGQEILIDKGLKEFFNGYVVFLLFYIALGEPSFILTILVLQFLSSVATAVIFLNSFECFLECWTEQKFYTGRFRPEVQPLTVLYTIFARKRTPCVYLPSQHTCMNSSASSTQPFPRRCGEQLASQKEESEKQQARSARREWWEPGRIKVGKWNERVRARRCDAVDWDSV